MSQRRQHRSKSSKKQKKGFPALWKWALGAVTLLLIASVVGYQMVIQFLHSDGFREKVSTKVSGELGVPVELGELTWSGLHLDNESVTASSQGAIEKIEANQISLNVDTDYIKRDVWKISDVVVQTASLELDLRKEFTKIDIPQAKKSWLEEMLPAKAELLDASVVRADAKIITKGGAYVVEGTQIDLTKEDFGYKAELTKGMLKLPFPILNEAELKTASLRLMEQRVVVDRASFDVFGSGKLGLDGQVELGAPTPNYSFFGILSGLKCADIVDEDWRQKLSGDVEAKFTVKPKGGNEPEFNGSIKIIDGQLTALPVLDTIAAYTVIRDFKRLRFSEFSCDFYRFGELLRISNIYVHCDGLMRIEGKLDMNGDRLSGRFNVGLNPGTLSHIPGAEDKVFLPGKEGMHWAVVNIGGTVDAIEEDLTDRIKAAALDRLFEMAGGQQVLRFTNQAVESLGDLPSALDASGLTDVIRDNNVIQAGRNILDSGKNGDITDPIKTGSDIIQRGLGGLFGGGSQKEEETDENKE
ncbi:hypothetical protein [Rubritalea profundi]|uniref:AsmA-like C-terminal domain-containing protein n=1 Tax=Rubritalea profundi TaxID=1658618 RepID=A0A2S7U5Q2_9BACT|nr:hypothetical protein [Rubritalea profundi]PQJ29724.1 hypothetical protein BSZ32_15330 [Rubritalea profundi]